MSFVKREGPDALVALRKVFWMRNENKPGPFPILVVTCRRPGKGAHIYEYFMPLSFSWIGERGETASIYGTIGPGGERVTLRWSAVQPEHDSGLYVSMVEFLPEAAPIIDGYTPPVPLPEGFPCAR